VTSLRSEGEFIEFPLVYRLTQINRNRIYRASSGDTDSGAARAYVGEFPDIRVRPKFRFSRSENIFAIGSHIARNFEFACHKRKTNALSLQCKVPGSLYERSSETPGNAALNVQTAHAVLDLMRLPERRDWSRAGAIELEDGSWADLMMSGLRHLTQDEMETARGELIAVYQLLDRADIVFISLEGTESWFDGRDRIFVNKSPAIEVASLRSPERYSFVNIDPAEAMECIEEIIGRLQQRTKGRARIVLSVSPVPVHGTYTADDVILADRYAKATLASAAQAVAARHDHVDYYPVLEICACGSHTAVWAQDGVTMQRSYLNMVLEKMMSDLLLD